MLLGFDDARIAERLNVPEPTVVSDLRGVLAKVGVEKREELPRKVFFDHYAARVRAGAPLGADGWFAG